MAMVQSSIESSSIRPAISEETSLSTKLVCFELLDTLRFVDSLHGLARRLVRISETAIAWRHIEKIIEASDILSNLPLEEARHAGAYYRAFALKRIGQRDTARALLEQVALVDLTSYQARALQTLGGMEAEEGRLEEARRFYNEAIFASGDHHSFPKFLAVQGLIALRGNDGDYRGFLKGLEVSSALVKEAARFHAVYLYSFQANVAYGLAKVGRIDEADAICRIVLESPYASAYHEWVETQQEIEAKRQASPVLVAIGPATVLTPSARPQRRTRAVAPPSLALFSAFGIPVLRSPPATLRVAVLSEESLTRIMEQVSRCLGSRAPPTSSFLLQM